MPGRVSVAVMTLAEALRPDVQPKDALYTPVPSDACAPPVSVARRLARKDLAAVQGADIQDHTAMVKAAVLLETRLRQLLDALDADGAS